ncbi:flagellar hook-associated protein FlgL [Vallitalea okinawensis]|uniref:flagellar hook-associated protein FlgL n=1 Tax=Vallitalea okinawensis TaxID=2078660 RepID=UPI000CFCF514|nr:flagellar hook-associated protein FlgL [Vallitalea okinawensis]
MRVTNQMVTNNTMLYLNNTQSNMLDIQQQLTTGKKIGKPSDDPIVAVRALKLKTDVSEISQYSRNVDDATSWIDVTEQALINMTDMYKRVRELTVQGSSGTYTYEDHVKMLEEIKQLNEQLAHEGNITYAGRYIFSGYKTDTPLIYTEDVTREVDLEETFAPSDIYPEHVVYGGDPTNPTDHPEEADVYKLRLAYDDVSNVTTDPVYTVDNSFTSETIDYGSLVDGTVYVLEDTGELVFNEVTANTLKTSDVKVSYKKTSFEDGDQVPDHYYKFNEHHSESIEKVGTTIKLTNIPIDPASVTSISVGGTPITGTIAFAPATSSVPANGALVNIETGEITFDGGIADDTVSIDYESIVDGTIDQDIEYEISIGQTMDVNTLGKDVLTTESIRDLEQLINNIEYNVAKISEYEDQIEVVNNDNTLSEEAKQEKIEDLEASIRVYSDQINNYYDDMTTNVDNAMKQLANETAVVGSKANRLELTANRLEDDSINFTELLSKTEDIDMTETIIELQSNQVVYNASLMATSQIVQQSLIDFLR